MTTATVQLNLRSRQGRRITNDHFHLLDQRRTGSADHLPIEDVLRLLRQLPDWPGRAEHQNRITKGARVILNWLLEHPGSGWQDRWVSAGADGGPDWLDGLAPEDTRQPHTKRYQHLVGLAALVLCRVIVPNYDFLTRYRSNNLFDRTRMVISPKSFARVERAAIERGLSARERGEALSVCSKIVLRTGKDLDQVTAEDVLELHAWSHRHCGRAVRGLHLAWDLLSVLGITPEGVTLRAALKRGQLRTGELVDDFDIQCRPVRDVLVRYLDERRPAMDYGSFRSLASHLAGRFWANIEQHHPGIDTLHLPDEAAQAWKERARLFVTKDGQTRESKDFHRLFMRVRAFYLDIQEWALEDPSWAPWAVPSPVRKIDTQGYIKSRKRIISEMHQRVRERLPHLPLLADVAERLRAETAALLEAAGEHDPGEVFDHAGTRYRRTAPKALTRTARQQANLPIEAQNLATDETTNLTRREDEAFWAWAVVETLRHTGIRLEELLEITHLALVSYQLPDTGEIVPLLQIVPSKGNEERLLLVSPELASVLATVITRLRKDNDGAVPLVARYDPYERVTGPPLPHLFQRALGSRHMTISVTTVYKLINTVLAATGLRDATGQPLIYTPHDFRRMFTTDAVTGGLPVHIAARLLGHKTVATTETYLAVFQEDLVRSYRAFLDKRRAMRPQAEYREPTAEEWREFQQHFQLRKVALGDCGRPYGTPCQHEHACLRCAMLRISPKERPRLVEIIGNLKDRIQEAKLNGWLGEVQGLEVSLNEATKKLVRLDRMRDRQPTGPVNLGIPIIRDPQ
ncbi:tyrosine-type recombinase/integrase [Saccharopolyspora hattusasensis]|uniref:tyrosine-type recombinase/integrase n=1 Tax=Saccharopolyspora hattusasensis TaxID=1128679 RepID=UPI003D98EFC9